MAYLKGTNPSGQTFDWYNGVTNDADTIIGNAGKDWIFGNGGNDSIKGGGGADYINGEEGRDTVYYSDSTVGVEVNLAGCYGKGGTAEGDTLLSVEDVVGSAYDDKLIGNWADNRLQGGGGSDVIKGGGGFDILEGGLGNDILQLDNFYGQLHGGEGTDTAGSGAAHALRSCSRD
jgi:Ca2+-binding RTX toxin-like protein